MPRAKQVSKRNAGKKTVPVLGAAGLSLLAGGASAATSGPAVDTPATNILANPQVTLGEEEISDVSLSTFYVFDKESAELPAGSVQLARGCGCGHGGGCGHGCGGGGCRGCGHGCGGGGCRGCGGGCGWGGWGGCGGWGCTCCLSWGSCRWC